MILVKNIILTLVKYNGAYMLKNAATTRQLFYKTNVISTFKVSSITF